MAGIYQRDNLANAYAANLERALARRDAYEKERAARVKSNVDAINNGLRAVGTAVTYGLSDNPQARLAQLRQQYLEALAAERGMEDYRPNPNLGGYSDYMGTANADYDLARLADFYRRGR